MNDQLTTDSARLTEVKREIMGLKAMIKPLEERLHIVQRERAHIESRIFIAANKINKEDVELSSGEGKPWFGTYVAFGEWLKANNITKPWAEWNGCIYNTSDVMAGRMPNDAPGYVDDLQ